jgi:hypothetical protein
LLCFALRCVALRCIALLCSLCLLPEEKRLRLPRSAVEVHRQRRPLQPTAVRQAKQYSSVAHSPIQNAPRFPKASQPPPLCRLWLQSTADRQTGSADCQTDCGRSVVNGRLSTVRIARPAAAWAALCSGRRSEAHRAAAMAIAVGQYTPQHVVRLRSAAGYRPLPSQSHRRASVYFAARARCANTENNTNECCCQWIESYYERTNIRHKVCGDLQHTNERQRCKGGLRSRASRQIQLIRSP